MEERPPVNLTLTRCTAGKAVVYDAPAVAKWQVMTDPEAFGMPPSSGVRRPSRRCGVDVDFSDLLPAWAKIMAFTTIVGSVPLVCARDRLADVVLQDGESAGSHQ
ncbi:hypothetical protein MMAG44476_25404 [Mycolicibacterium mageritense DSM 44476 = CIP 104973]|nr:hypothetical protein BN978_06383 [Mycolicibacterium mageritense DSM 44476 = CIP 104973]